MLKYKKQPHNSVLVWADSQDELGMAFMRFQEHYESPNPNFRNKIFTQGQLRKWYSETYGGNDYHKYWTGFNFPSIILKPFIDGLFDPLTKEENNLLDLFRYRQDKFYIIGSQTDDILRHELCHALYFNNNEYKKEIDDFIEKNKQLLKKASEYILSKGYCHEVLCDELQAYITDNSDAEIINNTCPTVIAGINQIYSKYNTGK